MSGCDRCPRPYTTRSERIMRVLHVLVAKGLPLAGSKGKGHGVQVEIARHFGVSRQRISQLAAIVGRNHREAV